MYMNSIIKLKYKLKIVTLLLILVVLVLSLFYKYHYLAQDVFGFEPKTAEILGTPSMYPTFPITNKTSDPRLPRDIVAEVKVYKYDTILSFFFSNMKHKLQRGDLVGFSTNSIRENQILKNYKSYLNIKRIIALPGETIEIRKLIIFVNGFPLDEPYIAKPFSTKPSNFLKEYIKLKIPQGKIFVMGDNREKSTDSRSYGPIDITDVKYYIPLGEIKYIPLRK